MSIVSRCASCRHTLLHAFVSFPEFPVRAALKPNKTKLLVNSFDHLTWIRSLTIVNPRRSDNAGQGNILPMNTQDEKAPEVAHTELDPDTPEPVSQQPWYLQVEIPQRGLRSLSERQQLPELPPDPPPLLQPILEHISTDLGLDELSLFDLRKLDPPPALGANLLIILGTARSEKHLQVSADRFCRWLRKEHKLTPYADGLMGRGELKLKMKRKARRARILSRVGSSERYSQDDGLTTGWICVNVGTIEDGKGAEEELLEPDGFAGFGKKFEGAKVVIQMLTDAKRMELDLEELCEKMLKKHERKEAKIKQPEVAINDGPSDNNSLQEQNLLSSSSSIVLSNHQKLSVGNYEQRREFHNTASHLELNKPDQLVQDAFSPVSRVTQKEQLDPDLAVERTAGQSDSTEATKLIPDKNLVNLQASLVHLKSLGREDAFKALGNGIKDWGSTSFLASFYKSYPNFPQPQHWECLFAMVCHAIRIGHPKYQKRNLMVLVKKMIRTIPDVPSTIAIEIFDTLLAPDTSPRSDRPVSMGYFFEPQDFLDALTVYDYLQHHRPEESVVQEDDSNLKKLLETLCGATAYASQYSFPFVLNKNVNFLFRVYMDGYDLTYLDTDTHWTVLNILGLDQNWQAFWIHWDGIAARMQPRSAELYALMFQRIAENKNPIQCAYALRNYQPEMQVEETPVKLEGQVAKAVMECLRVVAPDLQYNDSTCESVEAQYIDLWERCERGLLED